MKRLIIIITIIIVLIGFGYFGINYIYDNGVEDCCSCCGDQEICMTVCCKCDRNLFEKTNMVFNYLFED